MAQVSGVEAHSNLRQPHLLRPTHAPPQMSHHQSSYGAGHGPATSHLNYAPPPQGHSRKRSRPRNDLHLELHGIGLPDVAEGGSAADIPVELTPHGHHAQPQSAMYQTAASHAQPQQPQNPLATPQHHHHRLPNQPPPNKMRRVEPGGYGDSPPPQQHHGPPSVVGQEGMPPPAPRPRGPKLKFTPEDDQLLVDLKEKKNLTWKQIADFFPGRSSGTLQVRYCTKLKAKTTVWTDEMVQKLRNAMREYENDRWRIISTKVGSGFSPAACKDKAAEIATNEPADPEREREGEQAEESSFEQTAPQPESASSDTAPTYQ